jgi:hypothetical protein
MKFSFLFLVLFLLSVSFTQGQDKTTETRTTTDSTGKQVTTTSVVISKTEDITPRSGMIINNPLKFLLFYNISYYARVSANGAFGIGVQSPTFGSVNGFGINAEYRIYPSGKSPRGFYIAPNVSYNELSSGDSKVQPYSIGVLIGWQWFPGDEFALGLGIGMDYYKVNSSNKNSDFDSVDGRVPAVRFDIGYAW